MDRWDPTDFEYWPAPSAGRSEAAEDFGVALKVKRFGFWRTWILLQATYFVVGVGVMGVIYTLLVFRPPFIDTQSPVVLLIAALIMIAIGAVYLLLLYAAYSVWQQRASSLRP